MKWRKQDISKQHTEIPEQMNCIRIRTYKARSDTGAHKEGESEGRRMEWKGR